VFYYQNLSGFMFAFSRVVIGYRLLLALLSAMWLLNGGLGVAINVYSSLSTGLCAAWTRCKSSVANFKYRLVVAKSA